MTQASQDPSEDFKYLNINVLKKIYAQRWAVTASELPVKSITLYRMNYDELEYVPRDMEKEKYAVIVEHCNDPYKLLIESIADQHSLKYEDFSFCEIGKIISHVQLFKRPVLDKDFADEVYKEEPKRDYYKEWVFIPKPPWEKGWEKRLPGVKEKEPFVVLYPQKPEIKTHGEKLVLSQTEAPSSVQTKKRPNQIAKEQCRAIATKLWDEHPELSIKEMADRPEILAHGANWVHRTRHEWICELAPPKHRRPGRRRRSQNK